MIDILINQVDEHNESNILATQEFKPNLVYFIKDKDSEEKMKTLRLYYEKNFKNASDNLPASAGCVRGIPVSKRKNLLLQRIDFH